MSSSRGVYLPFQEKNRSREVINTGPWIKRGYAEARVGLIIGEKII